ncbi:MAG: hypothetical protein HYU88_00290 [Chloroflexi bacterium]|nr:hypothetical protein [Chloroflexota bacterium]
MASQSDLIAQLAERASKRIARRTVVALQRMKDGLQSGEDSGLRNLWDEICVQMQGQQSVFWDLYDHTL